MQDDPKALLPYVTIVEHAKTELLIFGCGCDSKRQIQFNEFGFVMKSRN